MIMGAIAMVAVSFLPVEAASAHCDGLDGPGLVSQPNGPCRQAISTRFSFGSSRKMKMK